MDNKYWIKKWQKDKTFYVENDRIKDKMLLYTPFPYTNLLGFQNAEILPILSTDVLARFNRMNNKNVLFPTGFNSLCNTSFIENKKISNHLNDDLTDIFDNQMRGLGIGINESKHINMRHDEYLSNLQQAFIDLYNRGYIEYKPKKVYYSKKHNKLYDYMNKPSISSSMIVKSFVLKIDSVIDDVLSDINKIKCDDEIKDSLIKSFEPKRIMKLSLFVSNGATIELTLDEPQFLGGVSYIFLNPEHIDITDYTDINEYSSIISYLENNTGLFAFSGLFAKNPLTGRDIPIFISTIYDIDIYLGIPGVDEDDRLLANEQELEIIEIIKDNTLINSDFLDSLEINEAREKIFNAFIEAEIADDYIEYNNIEILLSSNDNFGPLFPFLEDKDTGEIHSLQGHLPYAFSDKMRPVLLDNVDIIGNTMNGTINNLFTSGMCPILSIIYDDIGSIISIFSDEAYSDLEAWGGNECLIINRKQIYSSLIMPLIFYNIIKKESRFDLPLFIKEVKLVKEIVDIKHNKIRRINNNLIDFDKLLLKHYPDSIRIFMLLEENSANFIFDLYKLEDVDSIVRQCYNSLLVDNDAKSVIEYELYNLSNKCLSLLKENKVNEYVRLIYDFINNYILKYGLSYKLTETFIKIASPIMPFICEELNKELFNAKYSIINEDWPN